MKPILFFAQDCPDTQPFVAKLKALNIDYEEVEVLQSLPNFKRFLQLRDRHSAFDNAKVNGYIGIPALLLDNDQVILDFNLLNEIFA